MTLLFPPYRQPVIFLAGPIQGSRDWHAEALGEFRKLSTGAAGIDFDVASPRRLEVQEGEFSTEMYHEQVDWEHDHLDRAAKCGSIMFWLAKEHKHDCSRSYAQTTRFELGEAVGRHKYEGARVVVGIEEGFSNARYIRYTLGKKYPKIPIYDSLEMTCYAAATTMRLSDSSRS